MARKIRIFVNTGYPMARHETFYDLPDGWDDMTTEEQEKELDEMATDFRNDHIECGAYVVDDEKGDE